VAGRREPEKGEFFSPPGCGPGCCWPSCCRLPAAACSSSRRGRWPPRRVSPHGKTA